jgi:hypothetical protein
MAEAVSSHLVSQILSNDDSRSSKGSIHTGSAMSPGGSGISQGMGGSMDTQSPLSAFTKIESPIGGRIDGVLDTVNQKSALGGNMLETFDEGVFAPAANINFAKDFQGTKGIQTQPFGFEQATNAGLTGNSSLISSPKQRGG